jgi:hypothetical protein
MLVWKNQNPWTALRGFFYDYYLDYTGGYFGYRHGAMPVHIQLNLNDSVLCIVNQTANKVSCTAITRLYGMHGKLLSEQKNPVNLNSHDMILLNKIMLPKGNDEIYFLKLELIENDRVLDENLYWLSDKIHSYEKLNELEKVVVNADVKKSVEGHSVIVISNPGNETAFFIRLKIVNAKNELVLPTFLTDNYFTLLPGEEKQVGLDLKESVNQGNREVLKLVVEGWNMLPAEINF